MWQDNKNGIHVGISVPVYTTVHGTVRSIVPNGVLVLATYYDWKSEHIVPYVTSEFNIGDSIGDSLFNGGIKERI